MAKTVERNVTQSITDSLKDIENFKNDVVMVKQSINMIAGMMKEPDMSNMIKSELSKLDKYFS